MLEKPIYQMFLQRQLAYRNAMIFLVSSSLNCLTKETIDDRYNRLRTLVWQIIFKNRMET